MVLKSLKFKGLVPKIQSLTFQYLSSKYDSFKFTHWINIEGL